jgi:hypothetical protein
VVVLVALDFMVQEEAQAVVVVVACELPQV